MGNTLSEDLFERYCLRSGYSIQRVQQTRGRSCDYCVKIGDDHCWFEVKEFDPDPLAVADNDDPLQPLRRKVTSAYSQLKSHSADPCCLVVASENPKRPVLSMYVLTALYGRLMHCPPSRGDTDHFDPPYYFTNPVRWSPDGAHRQKMGRPAFAKSRNSIISAVVVVEEFRLAPALIRATKLLQTGSLSDMSATEYLGAIEQSASLCSPEDYLEGAAKPRCRVFLNPFARIPLPQSLFVGDLDVRWGLTDAGHEPIFVGQDAKRWVQRGVPVSVFF